MISRYSRKELVSIWSEENKYKIWLDVEIAAAEAMEKYKIIPKGVASLVKKKGKIKVKRIHDIEAKVKHDVIAFLTSITEQTGLKARYLHQGMTSSDVLDTTLNIQLVQSGNILLRDIDKILSVLKKQAKKYKLTPCIVRSHGIHAEPITFGLKLASFYEEFKRNKLRLKDAIENVSTCAISGAVGTFANINPKVETYVAKKLKLKAEPISTQIIPRDRHAHYFSVLGIIAGSVERVATEIRHLQRSEVYELQEYFSKDQKGSSAMPHKKNPILSEHLTGLARMVRSYVIPALENIFSTLSIPSFVKRIFFSFSSKSKSVFFKFLINLSTAIYCIVLSSAAPEITKGVLASSIKQESISSTIAKLCFLKTISFFEYFMLSLKKSNPSSLLVA